MDMQTNTRVSFLLRSKGGGGGAACCRAAVLASFVAGHVRLARLRCYCSGMTFVLWSPHSERQWIVEVHGGWAAELGGAEVHAPPAAARLSHRSTGGRGREHIDTAAAGAAASGRCSHGRSCTARARGGYSGLAIGCPSRCRTCRFGCASAGRRCGWFLVQQFLTVVEHMARGVDLVHIVRHCIIIIVVVVVAACNYRSISVLVCIRVVVAAVIRTAILRCNIPRRGRGRGGGGSGGGSSGGSGSGRHVGSCGTGHQEWSLCRDGTHRCGV